MKTTVISSLLVLGMSALAAGNSHKVDIQQDSVIEGKTVKAGEYKLSFENGNATLKMGKQSIEVPARQETVASKAFSDEFTYVDNKLEAIHISGTTTKIVFEAPGGIQSGS